MGRSKRFAIIGGGIGGLSLAIAMQRKGFHVTVYENTPVIKQLGAGLGLAANAVRAFTEIGISEDVLEAGSVLKKVSIKNQQGKVLAQTDSQKISRKYNVVNNFTIHRADLHDVLLRHLNEGSLQLGRGCVDFVQNKSAVKLTFQDGSISEADYVIACDGVHSLFRKKLLPESTPRYAGYTCWRAVIDNVPAAVDLNETSETWGAGSRFGIAPLNNNRLYWFACINAPENDQKKRSYGIKDLSKHFGEFHSPIPEILQHTKDQQLIWNDIIDIKPLKRFAFERILLMGDAAHATTPNMGQGACMAIEDAAILANTISDSQSVEQAFAAFERKRIHRTTTIVNESWQLGRVAQWENRLLISLRNTLLQLTPSSVAEKQIRFIQNVSFR
ncbi:MAG TPA: FAD-dependent monooxygenase [Chryseolinea sp.]|nr:FAD-dependent monooxygenase [Chryseolinea sp.]